MSFPANLAKHRAAVLEMLVESFRDGSRKSAMRTRGFSMEPLVRQGDEVVIRAVAPDEIQPGDVVAFRVGDAVLVHRIVAMRDRPEGRVFYEKGDYNLYLTAVEPERILGLVTELGTGSRRLDLRSPGFRRLGRVVAAYGARAVGLYARARRGGRRLAKAGSLPSRAAGALLRTVLRLPLAFVLGLARRLL